MLSGRSFRLKSVTLAIESLGDRRQATLIPGGEVIHILSGPRPDDKRMVDVLWDERSFVMFAEDIQKRGEEVLAAKNQGKGS